MSNNISPFVNPKTGEPIVKNVRRQVIENLRCVNEVFSFNDSDGTVCQLLKIIKICYPNADITYVSNMDMHNMPETKIRGITFETLK